MMIGSDNQLTVHKLRVQIAALLLENGADVNARNIYGQVSEVNNALPSPNQQLA
jgi:ankyrin repeat protein